MTSQSTPIKSIWKAGGVLLLLSACLWVWNVWGGADVAPEADKIHIVQRGVFQTWTPIEGTLEAVRREPAFSRISQPVTLVWVAEEGTTVDTGDVLARFDTESLQQSRVELLRDVRLAEAELNTLVKAEIPVQLETASNVVTNLEIELQEAQRLRDRTRELSGEGLLSKRESLQFSRKVVALEQQIKGANRQLARLQEVLHPAGLQKAEANLQAAREQLVRVEKQVFDAVIRAPISGMVVYQPLHLNGEYRTVRSGDVLYRNQRFLEVADLSQLVVRCDVPEERISLVQPECEVIVAPRSFPEMNLAGAVKTTGAVAMSVQGHPVSEKFFRIRIHLNESDARLRSGMSVVAQVLSHNEREVLTVPRSFIDWNRNQPYVWSRRGDGEIEKRSIRIKAGNESDFLISGGLEPGTVLVAPEES